MYQTKRGLIIKKTAANADSQGKQFASNTINDLFLAGK